MNYFWHSNRVRKFQNNLNDANDFQHRRWKLVTLLECMSGFWPYQSKLQQCSLQTIHFVILLSMFSAVANKTREYLGIDVDLTIECLVTLVLIFALIVKLMMASIKQHSRQKLYDRIMEHFKTITDSEETMVLQKCTDQGFIYTFTYICMIGFSAVVFDCVPIIEAFYHYIFFHEELIIQLPLQLNYGFDHNEYWYLIAIHIVTFMSSGILIEFSYDLSFMLQIRHVQALFKIVGLRLKRASENFCVFEIDTISDEDKDESYSMILSAIDLHVDCLEMVKMIEDAYAICWLLVLLLVTAISGLGIHFLLTKLQNPIDTFRYGCGFSLFFIHFFVIFSQGQIIMDSSSSVFEACYDCKWYSLPEESRKLLITMMIRSSIPCKITGGNVIPLSMETFGKLWRVCLWYYTLFEA